MGRIYDQSSNRASRIYRERPDGGSGRLLAEDALDVMEIAVTANRAVEFAGAA
jgi:hypothetical protein